MATCWRPGSQKKQEEREEVGEPALDMGFFDLINKVVSYCCIHSSTSKQPAFDDLKEAS